MRTPGKLRIANGSGLLVSNSFQSPSGARLPGRLRRRRLWLELLESRRVLAGNGPPNVLSITRLDANPTNQPSVAYRVLFDEAVQASTVDVTDFVLTRGGLLTGGTVLSVSGTGDTYTVQASTGSGDGTLRLDLIDDNTIRDLSGDRLGGNGPGNGNFTTGELYTLDRTPPSAVSLNRLSANPSAATSVQYALTFSEPVTGVNTSDFDFVASSVTGPSVSSISGSGTSYTITVSTGAGDGTLQLRLLDDDSIRDTATNRLGGTGANNGGLLGQSYTIDRAPAVLSVTPLDFTYTNASSVRFAVQFSKAVFGVDANDFAPLAFGVVGSTVTSVTGSDADYVVTLSTGSGDGSLFLNRSAAVTIVNSSGIALTADWPGGAGYTLDRTAPLVSSVTLLDPNPTNQSTVRFSVTFSEPVTSVDLSDFAIVSSGLVGASILSVTHVNNTVWTITVGTGTDQGWLSINILSANQILDMAGNALTAPVTSNPLYTIDRFPPVFQGVQRDAPALTNAATVTYTMVFSEAVTGLTIGALSVQATGLTGAAVQSLTGSGTNYTVTLATGSGQGTLTFAYDFTVVDQVGYTLHQTGVAPAYNVDRVVPSVVSLQPQLAGPTSNTDIFFNLQFSEPVSGVSVDDFQVLTTGAASGNVAGVTTANNINYTVRVTVGAGDGEVRLRLADDDSITDGINPLGGVGTGNGDFNSASGTLIQNPPNIVSIAPQGANPTASSVASFTVQFNEAVTGVDPSDFSLVAVGLTGAVISGVTGSGADYTLNVTNISGSGTLAVALNDDDTIVDGNALPLRGVGSAAAIFTSSPLLVIDQAPPVVSSLTATSNVTRAASVSFRLTFSENVSGVDASDFAVVTTGSIAGTSVSSVSVLGNVYTVSVAAGTGVGSLHLRLVDNDSIFDAVGLPLGGAGASNGDFLSTTGYSLENSGESSINGVLFQDLNNNGIREGTEPPLSNWSVYLDTDRNRQLSIGEPTTTTAADGSYSFTGLFSGQYNVSEVLPAQWEQTSPGAGNYPIKRISVTASGTEGTFSSDAPSLSADGRFVAFESSSLLVPGDTSISDIFVYDRVTDSLSKVSIGLAGALADGSSFTPAISNDGRMIAFASNATNLVAGDTNGLMDVFVYDRQTQTTTLVSRGPGGVAANGSSDSGIDISGDGRFVTFQSAAANLAPNDSNVNYDIFVVDLQNNDLATRIQLVSKSTSGVTGNGASTKPMINDDGSLIVFESLASNLVLGDTNNQSDIFLFNRLTASTRRISVTAAGSQVSSGSQGAAISGDGNFAGFWSNASNLITGDNNGLPDVFVVNLNNNVVELVSRTRQQQIAGGVGRPLLSTTGRYVAFTSASSLLTNSGLTDVFVRDRVDLQNNPLRRISQTQYGSASGGNSNFFGFSDDGRFAAFGTDAKHLISGDNNYARDVFMVDLSYQWMANVNVVTLGVSQTVSGVQFGNRVLQGEVTGTSWQDTSRNGFREAGEPANVGRQIYVDLNGNSVWDSGEPITSTDANGAFRLTPVANGQRQIREILPTNWAATSPANSVFFRTMGSRSVVLNFEEIIANVSSTIGVYQRDGFVLATSIGLTNQWRIDVPTGSNTVELVAVANGSVQQLFRNDYRPFSVSSLSLRSTSAVSLDFVGELQDGTTITQSASIPVGKTGVSLNAFTNLRSLRWQTLSSVYIDNISMQTTENDYSGLDFGSMSLPGQISGALYYDTDQDGQRDPLEAPIAGRRVYLDTNNNGIREPSELSVLSDASGNFTFASLNAGSYIVRQSLPMAWSQTEPTSSHAVNLQPNQTVGSLSFGSWGIAGAIQGTKWNDLNANGVREASEPGLAGWTIYVDLNNNNALDAGEPSTITAVDNPSTSSIDETGNYEFTNLAPLNYTVRELAQPGWQQTSPVAMQPAIQFNLSTGITAPIFQHHPDFDNYVSGTGRYEVFTTTTPLLAQDTNTLLDVYVLDRQLNSYELISVGLNGLAPNANSYEPTISDDGRYVAFRSFATTLTTTAVNSAIVNICVRDRVAGTTQLISNGLSGPANNFSYEPVISGDGRTLLFHSWASNLVADDTDSFPDLFIKDLVSGQLARVEVSTVVPTMPIGETWGGDISSDGRYVSIQAVSQGLSQIFRLDRSTNQIRLASTSSAGVAGDLQSEKHSISDDGRFIAFDSSSDNLTDEQGVDGFNVYLKDMVTGETRLISRNYLGNAANGSRRPEISGDGRWVVFESTSQNMFADSSNSPSQIVLYDRLTGTLTRLTGSGGSKGNAPSVNASISADGRTIAFQSTATNLGVSGRGLFTIDRTSDYTTPQSIDLRLAAGTTFSRADIGNARADAAIAGTEFEDTNRNGLRDAGETAIAGATIFIDVNKNGLRDTGEPTSVTGSDGSYSFNNLLPGSYTVRAELPASRVATGPATTRTRLFGVYGTTNMLVAELNPQTGAQMGTINPILNGTPNVGAAFDGTNVLLLAQSQNAIVKVLPNGSTARVLIPYTNYLPGLAYQNGLAYFIATINQWSNLVAFDVNSGQVVRTVPISHSIDGYGAGTSPQFGGGLGEAPDGNGLILTVADVISLDRRLLRLDTDTGRITQYVTPANDLANDFGATSAGGELFVSTANSIRVFDAQFQSLRTLPTPQPYYGMASGTIADYSQTITVQTGQSVSSVNFGQRRIASSITGQLFDDRNGNQQADAGEPALSGVTVYIDTNENFLFDAGEPSTQTNSAGRYTLNNVSTGGRTVRVVPLAGMEVNSPAKKETRLFGIRVNAGGGAILELDPITGVPKNQLSSPLGTNISASAGLAFDGTDLFVLEANTNRIYALNPDTGSVRRSLQLAGTGYDGLAAVGGKLYALDSNADAILEVDAGLTTILRTLDINQLNPNYLPQGATIDLKGALGENGDGTRLIAQATNGWASYVINPATGLIESRWDIQLFVGLAGAGGEVFATLSNSVLLDVVNSQNQFIRRGSFVTESVVGLGAGQVNSRGGRVVVQAGQDYRLDIGLRDNSTPTSVNFSSTAVAENLSAGSVVANLASVDANPNDQHQYALVPGTGDADNGMFEILGNQLRTRQVFDFENRNSFSIRLRTTDATGNFLETVQTISVINLPEVSAIQVGDGGAQRSTVDRLVIDLEGQVDIDAGAFLVQKRERDGQGALVLQTVTSTPTITLLPNGNTRVTLTFSGAYVRPPVAAPLLGALVDGNYQLTIDATKIRAAGTSTQLDGDRNGVSGGNYVLGAQATDNFFAMYGDSDGNRDVSVADFGRFRSAFGKAKGTVGYDAAFDYEGDEVISIADLGQFRSRFGRSLDF